VPRLPLQVPPAPDSPLTPELVPPPPPFAVKAPNEDALPLLALVAVVPDPPPPPPPPCTCNSSQVAVIPLQVGVV